MTTKKSEKLIEELVFKLRPVSPLYSPALRTLIWLSFNITLIIIYFNFIVLPVGPVMSRPPLHFWSGLIFLVSSLFVVSYFSFKF